MHPINTISIISAFIFGTGMIYILLDFTVGKIWFLNSKYEWHGLQIKDFTFLAIGAYIILHFLNFATPY